jgi:hypothetical protein
MQIPVTSMTLINSRACELRVMLTSIVILTSIKDSAGGRR